jgi:hypothetical protein
MLDEGVVDEPARARNGARVPLLERGPNRGAKHRECIHPHPQSGFAAQAAHRNGMGTTGPFPRHGP